MPQPQILADLKRALEPYRDKILFAYLFGSMAKGEARAGSDLDIAVYFADIDPDSYHSLKIDIYMALNRSLKKNDMDIVILNSASNLMLLDAIVRYGVVLLDAEPTGLREAFEVDTLHQAMDFKEQRQAVMGV